MKADDILAINKFCAQSGYYLTVLGEDKEHLHLIAFKPQWCDRFSMWLRFSPASMHKVIKYVNENRLFEEPSAEVSRANLALLRDKINSYENNKFCRFFSIVCHKICWVFAWIIFCNDRWKIE